jgi:hypothetical protein
MNPITIAFILFAAVLLFWGSLPFLTVYAKKKKQDMVKKLCREGAARNLTFCSQEILQNKVIGIDGIHRKIMVVEKTKKTWHCSTISLDEVHDCRLVTQSNLMTMDNNKTVRVNAHPSTALALQFEFNNNSQPASIIFSNGLITPGRELDFLKAKAEYWCIMFSKMLNKPVEVMA